LHINGRLSYIEDNERKTHDLSPSVVQVMGGATAQAPEAAGSSVTEVPSQEPEAPPVQEQDRAEHQQPVEPTASETIVSEASISQDVSANDIVSAAGAAPVAPMTLPPPGPPKWIEPLAGQGGVSGTRTITAVTATEMLVEVNIHKGAIRGFGKLQELIPTGFTALEKTNDEAIFTAQGTIVKFVWLNLPAKSDLKVVYKLRSNDQPDGEYVVNGDFGYLLNDETQKAVIGSTSFQVGQQALAQQPPVEEPKDTQEVVRQEPPKQPDPQKVTPGIPTPETGITYKVQISAAHREVGRAYFQERHRYSGDFGIERHEGWIKYTTGRFGQYREARDQRVAFISAGHAFPGPFVTAYNNGDRITVQEALMISNQRWVQ
jgi:hypothetical protein